MSAGLKVTVAYSKHALSCLFCYYLLTQKLFQTCINLILVLNKKRRYFEECGYTNSFCIYFGKKTLGYVTAQHINNCLVTHILQNNLFSTEEKNYSGLKQLESK